MPAPSEHEHLTALRKDLQEKLKDLPSHPAFQNPENVAQLPVKEARIKAHIQEIDARLTQLEAVK